MTDASAVKDNEFRLDEVVELKGHFFKIVLIDGYTGKIGLKWITAEEAKWLKEKPAADSR